VRETNKGKRFEAFALSACEDLISFLELNTNYMQIRPKVKAFGVEISTEVRKGGRAEAETFHCQRAMDTKF
jgi:hypothetical protein